uniref:Uncharacterized protein n=1 Tax=Anopheles albimanus TaxID=7167 RepID=A0A182F8G8_ANOAL
MYCFGCQATVKVAASTGICQQFPVVTKRYRPDGPIEPREDTQARQFFGVPKGNERIGGPGSKVAPRWIELDADAGAGVRFEDLLQLQVRVVENVHAALSVGEEEQIASIAPGDFVHLEAELLLGPNLVRACVNECDQIFLIAYRYRVTIGGPGCTLAHAYIPDANRFVTTGRAQQVRHRCMPAQLIYRSRVAAIAFQSTLQQHQQQQ